MGALRGNLPLALTALVGRSDQLDRVQAVLASARAVTLTGPGGVGKSRLALEAAARAADRFPDGTWWIELSGVTEGSGLGLAVTGALGITAPPGIDVAEALAAHLAGRTALVVLDGCEHLTGPCAELASTLTSGCPGLSMMATSRVPLGLDGESVVPVPPLSLPASDDLGALGRSAAVQLFQVRARQRGAEPEVGPAVAALVRRLDGLPLAIELAASRTRVLTPAQILQGLDEQLGLLSRTAPTTPVHHRSVRASIEWSHDLLDEEGRVLLRRLAAFAGAFTLSAVEEVCSGPPLPAGVLDVLTGLVDHSLVQVRHDGPVATYRLLDTVRRYALERLEVSGEDGAVRDRHLHSMIRLAEAAEVGLDGPDHLAWLERLRELRSDLRTAMEWAARTGQTDAEASLAAGLWFFWLAVGEYESARRVVRHLTPASAAVPPPVRARLLLHSGGALAFAGDIDRSRQVSSEALELGARLGDDRIAGRAHFQLSLTELWADPALARAHLEAAVSASRSAGDDLYLAMSLTNRGLLEHLRGNGDRAEPLLREGLDASRRTGNVLAIGNALMRDGLTCCELGAPRDAIVSLEEALALSRGFGGDGMLANFQLPFLGRALIAVGDLDGAERVLSEALVTATAAGFAQAQVFALLYQGVLATARGQHDRAVAVLGEALERSRSLGFVYCAAHVLAARGIARVLLGDLMAASRDLSEAEDLARETWAWPWAEAVIGRAGVALRQDDPADAGRLATGALDLAMRARLRPLAMDALDLLAAAHARSGRRSDAVWLAAALQAERRRTGSVPSPLACGLGACEQGLAVPDSSEELQTAVQEGSRASLVDAARRVTRGRGPRGRPAYGWESLTPTELEVVRLVAEGLTNPQVAQQLFVSPRTVQSHLRRVFSRLGVSTRTELAALAARHDRESTGP